MNVPKLRFKEFDGEWEKETLQSVSLKIGDGLHATPQYEDFGEYYFINGNNLINGKIIFNEKTKRISKEEFQKYKFFLSENTILLSINGTIGNLAFYDGEKVLLGKSVGYIALDKEKVNEYFIYFLLQTSNLKRYFKNELTGTTIKNLSLGAINKGTIYLPHIQEQNMIGDLFKYLDKKIQLQQQKIDLLQEQKKGYMQKIFDNNKSDTSGEKWERINLNEIFLIIDGDRGKNYPSEEEFLEHGHTLFLDTKNVTKKGFKFNTKKFISEEKCKKMNNGLLMRNDLVLTSRGTIGNLALYDDSVPFNSVRINSAMLILRLVKPDISLMFLYHLLKSKVLIDFIRSSSVGSAQPHITKKDLKSLKVTFPSSLVSQEKIARFLSLIDESVKFEEEKLGLLLKQKQGFMQQMFI